MSTSRRVVLHFPSQTVDQPVISNLIKHYDLSFNIMKASIIPDQEGFVVLELTGDKTKLEAGLRYLATSGVKVESLSQKVLRDEELCTQCGVCVSFCPTGAFQVDQATRVVSFKNELCVACGLCIKACPPRAMEFRI
jgi:L-aspartate semialdehyde sulfurtransferase ferredoxin